MRSVTNKQKLREELGKDVKNLIKDIELQIIQLMELNEKLEELEEENKQLQIILENLDVA